MSAKFTFEKTCLLAIQVSPHYNVSLVGFSLSQVVSYVRRALDSHYVRSLERIECLRASIAHGEDNAEFAYLAVQGRVDMTEYVKSAERYRRMRDKLDKQGLPPSSLTEAQKLGALI
jgi:hypothetical protein